MSVKIAETIAIPPLLPGRIVHLPGRGEMFVRHHEHPNPHAPTLLLLHGWTASSDVQFFTAYESLARDYSIIGVDHRGHGRGMRPNRAFSLEDCADDAAAVVRALGVRSVISVGYSMGGPISLLVWQRHSDLVDGMVFQATALEWNATRAERNKWRFIHVTSPIVRRLTTPRTLRFMVRRALPRGHELSRYLPWLVGEMRRNDQWMIAEAGRSLAKFDARVFAQGINVPTSVVLTTNDQLVPPVKQQALAATVGATVIEIAGDHFVSFNQPREYDAVTNTAIELVARQTQQ
jgi:pimeloyl-ACP methyl ester carboxylesterase